MRKLIAVAMLTVIATSSVAGDYVANMRAEIPERCEGSRECVERESASADRIAALEATQAELVMCAMPFAMIGKDGQERVKATMITMIADCLERG